MMLFQYVYMLIDSCGEHQQEQEKRKRVIIFIPVALIMLNWDIEIFWICKASYALVGEFNIEAGNGKNV